MSTCQLARRRLGSTALHVSQLGFGTAQIGLMGPQQCRNLLNSVLDRGINVMDTSPSFGPAERLIGKYLSHRRDEYILITKGGQQVDSTDPPAWTSRTIRHTLERSLQSLQTDHIDLFFIDSCPAERLENTDMLDALQSAREKGDVRYLGYSGDGVDAMCALSLGIFDCVECSINICDQQALDNILPRATELGLGVLAKRGLANTCWRSSSNSRAGYGQGMKVYIERLQEMRLRPELVHFDGSMLELALRFVSHQPNLASAIIGGQNLDHIEQNLGIYDQGPLPENVLRNLRHLWIQHDDGRWMGQN